MWLCAMLAVSCHTVLDYEVPSHDARLVATSFFTPDSTWSVSLYRSQSVNEIRNTVPSVVEDAVALILRGASVEDTLRRALDGRYRSTLGRKPESFTNYTLRVQAPGLPPVEATAAAPHRPVVADFKVEELAVPIAREDLRPDTHRMELRIVDAPGRSTYRIGFFEYVEQGPSQNRFRQEAFGCGDPSVYHDYDDLDSGNRDTSTSFWGYAILPDDLFQGGTHNLALTFRKDDDIHRYMVVVSSLSTEYVEYQHTLLLNPSGRSQLDDFITPTPIYTNIEGGFGVFAGYADTTLSFDLES